MTDAITQLIAELEQVKGSPAARECSHRCFVEYRRTKNRRLRNALIESYLGLAVSLAHRYRRRGVADEDLNQVAFIGLLKAVERFDPDLGIAFTSFATPTILGELRRYFRDFTWAVKMPRRLQEQVLALNGVIGELTQWYGRTPRPEEIAERLGWEVDRVLEALDADAGHDSVPLEPAADVPAGYNLAYHERGYDNAANRSLIEAITADLSDQDRQILELRFAQGLTQTDIARRMGVSQMQVSRLLTKIFSQLRQRAELDPAPSG